MIKLKCNKSEAPSILWMQINCEKQTLLKQVQTLTEPQPSKSILGARYEGLGIASTPLFGLRQIDQFAFSGMALVVEKLALCSERLKFRSTKISFAFFFWLKNRAKFPRPAPKN